jgi:hypothetical protein
MYEAREVQVSDLELLLGKREKAVYLKGTSADVKITLIHTQT